MEESRNFTTGVGQVEYARLRTACAYIFVILLVASAIALRQSVITTPVRGLLLATLLVGLFTGLLYFLKYLASHARAIYPAIFGVALFITWLVLGSRSPEIDMLRNTYILRLGSFNGVRYLWGGETNQGIDCSGLARAAFWQTLLTEGVREANPRLLCTTFWSFWWRDMSAKDMLDGKYGYTHRIGCADRLAGYNTSKLRRGDLAITRDGVHVMIYYGDGRWIEASPDDQRVVINPAPANTKRGWFRVPVVFVRWWILQD